MQNQRLKMPNTCKPCHFKIIWPVNWDYSSGQLVPRISDCKLNGFVWRMIPSEGISTALNIQSACPTPHQNSLLLVLCKAQAASLAAAPDARWYLEFPEAYTVSWQGNAAWWRPSTVPPAPSCHILNACLIWAPYRRECKSHSHKHNPNCTPKYWVNRGCWPVVEGASTDPISEIGNGTKL